MAVPGSGSLSLWGISKELTITTDGYDNTVPLSTYQQYYFTSMSLHDMETQGNTYRSSSGPSSYPTLNTSSSSRPDGSNPNEMSEWYSYNHQAVSDCLIRTNYDWTLNNPTGCSISTAFSGNSGGITRFSTIRYARFDAGVDGIFTVRLYRNSNSSYLRLRVYKSNGQVSGSLHSISNMTLKESVSGSGYTTVSFPVNEDDEILIKAEHTGSFSTFNCGIDRCFINDLSSCQYTSYTQAKLFGTDSSTPSSSYYSTSASTIIGAAGYSYNNSSAWSTVYIHHCTSTNPIEPGNTVYQTSNLTTKVSWSSGSSWRAITTDTSFPLSGIRAIYNGHHYTTTNIENTSGDSN